MLKKDYKLPWHLILNGKITNNFCIKKLLYNKLLIG
jgi:hypothetical protein